MTEELIGYKVLAEDRKSVMVTETMGKVHYPLWGVAVPNKDCGPLCIFDSMLTAIHFKTANICLGQIKTIVVCAYTLSHSKSVWNNLTHKGSLDQEITLYMPLTSLPRGTILADSVTCLE